MAGSSRRDRARFGIDHDLPAFPVAGVAGYRVDKLVDMSAPQRPKLRVSDTASRIAAEPHKALARRWREDPRRTRFGVTDVQHMTIHAASGGTSIHVDATPATIAALRAAAGDAGSEFIAHTHAAADTNGDVKLPNAIAKRLRSLGMAPVAGGIPVADVDRKLSGLPMTERIAIKQALAAAKQIKSNP